MHVFIWDNVLSIHLKKTRTSSVKKKEWGNNLNQATKFYKLNVLNNFVKFIPFKVPMQPNQSNCASLHLHDVCQKHHLISLILLWKTYWIYWGFIVFSESKVFYKFFTELKFLSHKDWSDLSNLKRLLTPLFQ